jgi:hypothetical protein
LLTGPTRLPLLGNLLELVIKNKKKVPYLVLKDLSLKYGPVMTLKVGTEWQSKWQNLQRDVETVHSALHIHRILMLVTLLHVSI